MIIFNLYSHDGAEGPDLSFLHPKSTSGAPIEIYEQRICGIPQEPLFEERSIAEVKWVDGTNIDVIQK